MLDGRENFLTPDDMSGERKPHGESGERFPEMESPDNVSIQKLALDMIVMRNTVKELQERVEQLENDQNERS